VGVPTAREVLEIVEEREAGVAAHREDDAAEHRVYAFELHVGRREEVRRRLVMKRVSLRGERAMLVVIVRSANRSAATLRSAGRARS